MENLNIGKRQYLVDNIDYWLTLLAYHRAYNEFMDAGEPSVVWNYGDEEGSFKTDEVGK